MDGEITLPGRDEMLGRFMKFCGARCLRDHFYPPFLSLAGQTIYGSQLAITIGMSYTLFSLRTNTPAADLLAYRLLDFVEVLVDDKGVAGFTRELLSGQLVNTLLAAASR